MPYRNTESLPDYRIEPPHEHWRVCDACHGEDLSGNFRWCAECGDVCADCYDTGRCHLTPCTSCGELVDDHDETTDLSTRRCMCRVCAEQQNEEQDHG